MAKKKMQLDMIVRKAKVFNVKEFTNGATGEKFCKCRLQLVDKDNKVIDENKYIPVTSNVFIPSANDIVYIVIRRWYDFNASYKEKTAFSIWSESAFTEHFSIPPERLCYC